MSTSPDIASARPFSPSSPSGFSFPQQHHLFCQSQNHIGVLLVEPDSFLWKRALMLLCQTLFHPTCEKDRLMHSLCRQRIISLLLFLSFIVVLLRSFLTLSYCLPPWLPWLQKFRQFICSQVLEQEMSRDDLQAVFVEHVQN